MTLAVEESARRQRQEIFKSLEEELYNLAKEHGSIDFEKPIFVNLHHGLGNKMHIIGVRYDRPNKPMTTRGRFWFKVSVNGEYLPTAAAPYTIRHLITAIQAYNAKLNAEG